MLKIAARRALLHKVERLNGEILFRIRPADDIAAAMYRRNLVDLSPGPVNRLKVFGKRRRFSKRTTTALWIAAVCLAAAIALAAIYWR
jgi:hypothetical protein